MTLPVKMKICNDKIQKIADCSKKAFKDLDKKYNKQLIKIDILYLN